MSFAVVYVNESWSGLSLMWGGVYPDFPSCCEDRQKARGMVFQVETGIGVEICDALDLHYNRIKSLDGCVPIYQGTGCWWDTREKWYERIGEKAPERANDG